MAFLCLVARSQWSVCCRPLVYIQFCIVLPPPSSSSCTWNCWCQRRRKLWANGLKQPPPHKSDQTPNLTGHFQVYQKNIADVTLRDVLSSRKTLKLFSARVPNRNSLGELTTHKYLKYLFIINIFPFPWSAGEMERSPYFYSSLTPSTV